MLRIFRTGSNLQLVVVFLTAILLWSDAFFFPSALQQPSATEPFYAIICRLIYQVPLISTLCGFFVLLLTAIFLNRVLSDVNILPRNSYITAFTYIILMSSQPELLIFHPLLPGHLFMVLMMRMIFRFYERQDDYAGLFNAGFFAGLATFFSFSLLPFLLLIWLSLFSFRRGSLREWIIPVTGFALPYVFLFSYYFWFDSFGAAAAEYANYIKALFASGFLYDFSVFGIITSGLMMVILFQTLYFLLARISEKVISQRKMYSVVLWMMLLSIVCCFTERSSSTFLIAPLILPLSILMAHKYMASRRLIFDEFLLLIFLAAIILQKIYS